MKNFQDILNFWFTSSENLLVNSKKWFTKDEAFDCEIREKFQETYAAAISNQLTDWQRQPRSCLALIITLDQFSRNLNRNSAEAFAFDPLATQILKSALEENHHLELHPIERWFFYMPLMHSECKQDQELSLKLFKELSELTDIEEGYSNALQGAYKFAIAHADIVFKYGRYPHRNKVMGRESTPEEIEFLKQPGSSF